MNEIRGGGKSSRPLRAAAHVRLLGLATLVWLGFWIAGLPDYYQQYSFTAMLAFSIALVPAIVLIAWRTIGRARIDQRKQLGFWLSFYFTVPLLVFDYLYCGLYLGIGWRFLAGYWYLTVFYFIPWLILVPTSHLRARERPA